ncbi:MAG: PilZ domain-containing protein [Treponema sp.]|jgi:hypothetical protein|nr:PilZ domain-containing protein [Treponema sp.]
MRKNNRYVANAEVHVFPFPERRVALKDISLNGCCIHSDDFLEILPNTCLMIGVTPKDSPDVKNFAIDVKSRWIRTRKNFFESGFEILASEKSAALEQYIEFLAQKQR